MSTHSPDFEEVQRLLSSFATTSALMELGLLLGCLALSWLVVSRLKRFAPERPGSVLFGSHVVDGVLFHVLALVAAFAARRAQRLLARLGRLHPVDHRPAAGGDGGTREHLLEDGLLAGHAAGHDRGRPDGD